MPPVCKFWQQGSCRFGDQCRFEHPVNRGYTNGNRYGVLADTSNSNSNPRNNNNSSYLGGSSSSNRTLPYLLDKNAILTDLTTERPQWILSAYGPGRYAPAQLFGGLPREQSFEEMRLLHYMGLASGNPQQAVQEAEGLVQQSEHQIQTAVNNIDAAIQYLIDAEKEHPNRIDICQGGQPGPGAQPNPLGGSTPFGAPARSTFGAPSQPATTSASRTPTARFGAFGQPSQLGQKPSPFGVSAPTQLSTTGAFGNPSQLGQKPNPFGTPSGTGGFGALAGTSNPFGQHPASTPFGAPSQPAAVSNTFGAPSQTSISSPFGAPSQPATSSPFGAPSQPATSSLFRAPSQAAQANPFARQPPANPSPFGAPSQSAQVNPFGSTPSAPFGGPSPAPSNPFGAPSQPQTQTPFSQPPSAGTSNANPFVHPQSNSSPFSNSFSKPVPAGPSAANSNAFGADQSKAAQSSVNGFTNGASAGQHPEISSYSTRDASGRLITFKGNRVVYKDQTPGFTNRAGKWEKIWFPDGPPTLDPQAHLPPEVYDQKTKEQYEYARQHGKFKDGVMPLLPPLREMCRWDF